MNCRGMQEPRHGLTAQPGQPMSLCARVCFARSYLFGRAWWHVKPVSLILGTGHDQYELAHTQGSCQGYRGNHHFASENAVQEVIIEIGFIHLADIAKHDGTLRLAGLHHHEGDAAAIWPVTALTKKNSSQFGHGKILNRVSKVNDNGQI